MVHLLFTVFLLLRCSSFVFSESKILIVNHAGVSSHGVLFDVIIDSLVEHNHDVTYLTNQPYNGKFDDRIHQRRLNPIRTSLLRLQANMKTALQPAGISVFSTFLLHIDILVKDNCSCLENENFITIINSTKKYDVIILNAFLGECLSFIGYKMDAPVIQVSPSIAAPWHNTLLGIGNNFGIEKMFFLDFPEDRLLSRVHDVIIGNAVCFYRNWVFPAIIGKWLIKNYPEIRFPPFHELEKKFSLQMINTAPAMGYAKPITPSVVEIGGAHCFPPNPLSAELNEFISEAGPHGFLYISFGSHFESGFIPEKIINVFLEVFKLLPQRVLWKYGKNMTELPPNVMVLPWLPQQDLLGDPRLRLFITQAGILSMQEAAFHGVPVIGFPILVDQFTNSKQAQKLGYGINLDLATVTRSTLMAAIQRVANDTRFKDTAKMVSAAMKDTMMTPKQRIVWWVEYVIRNNGTERLRTATQGMPWYQQQQLDVAVVLVATGMLLVASGVLFIKILFKIMNFIFVSIKLKLSARKQKRT